MGSQVRVDDVDVVDPGRASPMEKFPLGFRASLLGFSPTAGRLSSPMVTWYINCSILHHLRGNMRDISPCLLIILAHLKDSGSPMDERGMLITP